MATRYSVADGVALIRLDNPPVNGLGHDTRVGIVTDLRRALAAPDVAAVVLTGGGGFFSAGADITEFGTPAATAEPTLSEVISALEDADKPVVAAIDGTCFGGGLELALGAHYRVVTAHSKIGLPEVKLGLVPGAGGTQRLPRVVEVATAIDMITGGAPRVAGRLAEVAGQRLFDKVVEHEVVAAAVEFAQEVASVRPLPRVRDLAAAGAAVDFDAVRAQLRKRGRGFLAPVAALDLVETAVTAEFAEGKAAESATFAELLSGSQSAAMRHAFFAERAARKIPGISRETGSRSVETVGVIGAGTMGGGIAMNFLGAGIPVRLLEMKSEPLEHGVGVIRRNYQAQVDKGKLTAAALEERMGLLAPTLEYQDLAGCDLVIEAVFEDMDVKRAVFGRLDEVLAPGAILASNTSTLDVDAIAAITSRPADVLGMHFFSPANVMPLLEVVRGKETADDVLATAMSIGQRVGKTAVVSGVCDGFIGNRMLAKYQDAAMTMLHAGATPAQIDSAIEGFGFAMGPFRMGDLAGLDIGWAIRKRRYAETPDTPRDEIADALCELGRFGQKTGGGWYDYEAGRRDAIVSPVVEEQLAAFHLEHGTQRQDFDPSEIVERLVFALVDEGARILEEGIALRSSDIDVVYLAGYGFPRHVGGPMFYADRVGAAAVVSALQRFHGPSWVPAPLLVRLAAEGGSFASA
ncbi:3-hydroxyacyl-CoA dehydrogenase NAD-binding domain-containing protein [Rhodococcus tukisamuensis]|uniref:3-hydroxyacyl-CoA dehydrogenase n=1 Tax=Rhodococcus tukisamuensis TaxID=168276 RepID=A0A1G7DLY5_9NOCA|nr:3-hydroxyacyl-CoA dehydrogenase NAD-binding domain-containing protein [Rhodococcus tukisamuensis]SDE52574.1 3-hydroxyacyl-CoA dehydrogenase [Rhodococcus tukisamuensis]